MSRILFKSEALRAVAPFQSTEETRYYLNGVFFDDRLLVATDGHRMAIVKPTDLTGRVKEPFIMPMDTVKAILKVKAEKRREVWVMIDTKKSVASVYQDKPDMDQPHLPVVQLPFVAIDGTFPEYRRVIPRADDLVTGSPTGFNTQYLADFKSFGTCIVVFTNVEPRGPSLVRASSPDFDAVGVLMPMRGSDTDMVSHPKWLEVKTETVEAATVEPEKGDTDVPPEVIAATTGQPSATENCVNA